MNQLYLQLMGQFHIRTDERKLTEGDFHSFKLIQLLAYLALSRDRDVQLEELMRVLGQKDDTKKFSSTLKNLVCRLRKELKFISREEIILTVPGGYRWNPEIDTQIDLEIFEKEALAVLKDGSEEAFQKLGVNEHSFELSAKLTKNEWFRALELQGMETYREVLQYMEMHGSADAEQEAQDGKLLHKRANGKNRFSILWDVASFVSRVSEQEKPRGAFRCDYETFRNIYQLEARRCNRLKPDAEKRSYIMLLTLERGDHIPPSKDPAFDEYAKKVGQTIGNYLRADDIITQCSVSQYAIIIGNCSEKEANMVAGRICDKNSNRFLRQTPYVLRYEVQELKNIEKDL